MSDVPAWLETLAHAVARAIRPDDAIGPLGLRYREDGPWDVLLYPLPIELVGGASDGAIVAPAFSLDTDRLRAAFERADELLWLPHAPGGPEGNGPCLSLRGSFQGHDVWLRVLAFAPEDEGPAGKIDMNARRRPA